MTPEFAIDYLQEMSAQLRAAAVLTNDGQLLAGDERLLPPAREFQRATQENVVEVQTSNNVVFFFRGATITLIAVCNPFVLSSLMLTDLRLLLEKLEAGDGKT